MRDARRHHDPLARPEGVHGGSQSAARGPLEDVERLRPSPMYVRRAPRCCTLGTVDLGHPAAAPVSWAAFTTTSRVLVIGSVVSKPWLIIPCSPEREEMRRVLDDTGVHLRGEAAPAATPGWVGRPGTRPQRRTRGPGGTTVRAGARQPSPCGPPCRRRAWALRQSGWRRSRRRPSRDCPRRPRELEVECWPNSETIGSNRALCVAIGQHRRGGDCRSRPMTAVVCRWF